MALRSLLTIALLALQASAHFNPREYTKKTAHCPAINRAENKTVDLALHYVDINPTAERTLLMVHGWPSLWASWKFQIEAFRHDYRLVVPDLRGFGASQHPGDVATSGSMPDLVNDLSCILKHADVEHAICIGHDWGTQTCYEAARQRPTLIDGVVGITIPYMPYKGPYLPISVFVPELPHLAYQVYFDADTSAATHELDLDIRRTLRATLRTVASPPPEGFLSSTTNFLGAYANISEIPPIPFFTADEEDYWVEQYSIQKFDLTLYFYKDPARRESWQAAQDSGKFDIDQPALSILDTQDPVANWPGAAQLLHSASFLPNLTTKDMHGAHWVHLEYPKEVNAIIREWLEATFPATPQNQEQDGAHEHIHEEL